MTMSTDEISEAAANHKWREISDLPAEVDSLRDRELESLREVWASERQSLDEGSLRSLNVELAREWSIETGIIEKVYSLDRGVTQTLIEKGIASKYITHNATNRDPELVTRIIQGHEDVLDGLFAFVKNERQLTVGYIKELHAALLRYQESVAVFDQFGRPLDVPLERGVYKKLPNNPHREDGTVHEYCPPEHVASEMDRLISMHRHHLDSGVTAHIEAAWLHHAFTQIHPFQDGNGRVARAIASLVLIKDDYFPFLVNRDDYASYVDSLERADEGKLPDFVSLVARFQKRLLIRAISQASDAKPANSVDEAVRITSEMLVGLGRITPVAWVAAKENAAFLADDFTNSRFREVAEQLEAEIGRSDRGYSFSAATFGDPPRPELRVVAERLKYDINTAYFQKAPLLQLSVKGVENYIAVSFHGIGSAFRGVLVASAYFQTKQEPPVVICDDLFRVSYNEARTDVVNRYKEWLDQVIIRGLAEWRRALV